MTIGFRSETARSIVMLDGVDRIAFNEDGSMELLTPSAAPTGNKVMTVGQMPFSKEYVSAEQVITSAGQLTLPHGLGSVPKVATVELVCVVAEQGYSIGDVVQLHSGEQSSATQDASGMSLRKSATTITVRFGSAGTALLITNATTGAGVGAVNANWRLVVRAWA